MQDIQCWLFIALIRTDLLQQVTRILLQEISEDVMVLTGGYVVLLAWYRKVKKSYLLVVSLL